MNKKPLDTRKLKSETQHRSFTFLREAINTEARTVELAFASETEKVQRWWGTEILDCGADSVRLERLLNKAPLLFNHDRDQLLGVVESVSLGQDRVCRATVRFGNSEDAEEKFRDVQDGILTKVSVGYAVHELVLEKESDEETVYRITDWEPFEISMVTIPADDSVGVGRSLHVADPPATDPLVAEAKPNTEARESGLSHIQIKEPKMDKTIEQLEQDAQRAKEQLSAEQFETKRREAIIDIGAKYDQYITLADIQRAVNENWNPPKLQELVIERMTTKHADVSAGHIGMDKRDIKNFSIARAVKAVITGDWRDAALEREAAEACSQRFGQNVQFTGRNIVIPYDVMTQRDFTVGAPAEAGNLVATDLRGDMFVDILRNRLCLGRLGVTMLYGLTGNVDLPRKVTGSSLGWLTEIGAAGETQPNTGKVTLSPKRIGGFIEYSKQSVIQSALAVEPMLRGDLESEYLVQAENAGINGTAASNQPRGIRNTAGIGSVVGGANGAQLAWSHVVGLESAVANVNAEPDANAGYLINTKTRGFAKQTLKAVGFQQFIWDGGAQPLNGYRAEVSNNVPSNLTKGTSNGVASSVIFSSGWDMLVLGTFGAVELTLDEVTQATNGMNRLILNAFMDVACRRAANFAVMDDALTA